MIEINTVFTDIDEDRQSARKFYTTWEGVEKRASELNEGRCLTMNVGLLHKAEASSRVSAVLLMLIPVPLSLDAFVGLELLPL